MLLYAQNGLFFVVFFLPSRMVQLLTCLPRPASGATVPLPGSGPGGAAQASGPTTAAPACKLLT